MIDTGCNAPRIGYAIQEDRSLAGRTSFRVAAHAWRLIDVHDPQTLPVLFADARKLGREMLVLGGGSNVLFTRDWPGVVLTIATRGTTVVDDRGESARVRVEAGENWNDFVRWSLGQGFSGLENLVLIPGTVGAAPIQNIGAYGVEVGEFIAAVEAWDRDEARFVRLDNADCAFGYRDSRFKRERERYVVTAVEFDLPHQHELRLDYAGIGEELAALGVRTPTPSSVAEAIARIRTRKLPDPSVIGNAGSFFKNPIVAAEQAQELRREFPDLQAWPMADGGAKLSAARMIESLGFRGQRVGDAGVSDRHALVLVNHGRASGAELWALAERIRVRVRERYGVLLEAEPLVI